MLRYIDVDNSNPSNVVQSQTFGSRQSKSITYSTYQKNILECDYYENKSIEEVTPGNLSDYIGTSEHKEICQRADKAIYLRNTPGNLSDYIGEPEQKEICWKADHAMYLRRRRMTEKCTFSIHHYFYFFFSLNSLTSYNIIFCYIYIYIIAVRPDSFKKTFKCRLKGRIKIHIFKWVIRHTSNDEWYQITKHCYDFSNTHQYKHLLDSLKDNDDYMKMIRQFIQLENIKIRGTELNGISQFPFFITADINYYAFGNIQKRCSRIVDLLIVYHINYIYVTEQYKPYIFYMIPVSIATIKGNYLQRKQYINQQKAVIIVTAMAKVLIPNRIINKKIYNSYGNDTIEYTQKKEIKIGKKLISIYNYPYSQTLYNRYIVKSTLQDLFVVKNVTPAIDKLTYLTADNPVTELIAIVCKKIKATIVDADITFNRYFADNMIQYNNINEKIEFRYGDNDMYFAIIDIKHIISSGIYNDIIYFALPIRITHPLHCEDIRLYDNYKNINGAIICKCIRTN